MTDRQRMAYLAARGIQTVPLTWIDLDEGERSMRLLADTLAARRR